MVSQHHFNMSKKTTDLNIEDFKQSASYLASQRDTSDNLMKQTSLGLTETEAVQQPILRFMASALGDYTQE